MIGRVLPVAAVGLVVGLDVAAKRWAEAALRPGEALPLIGDGARLRLGYNPGIAFGLFGQPGLPWVVPLGFVVAAVAVWLLRALRRQEPEPVVWPLAAVLGGGAANLLDRWPDGRVTDAIDIGIGAARWPAFNLADAAIVLGVVLLVAASIRPVGARPGEAERGDG